MLLNYILLIVGLALVIFGADFLVDGAASIARKFKISEFVIGLTIVGFGTSCPELVVSVTGAIQNQADIAVGNVIGSNIFNTLFILGLSAIIIPIRITPQNRKRDIPITLAATVILILAGLNRTLFGIGAGDNLSRTEGILFLLFFSLYMISCFTSGEKKETGDSENEGRVFGTAVSVLMTVAGLAALIVGGRLFVNSSVAVARQFNLSEKFIAITLLAGGTSLPELVTGLVAALKGKDQLALGNILGSNIFNILLILGISSCITPLSFDAINIVDISVLVVSILVVWIPSFTFSKNKISRTVGTLLVAIFIAYYIWLFKNL